MNLHLVTPSSTQNYTIQWLEVVTPQGDLVIQPGHAPIILVLVSNKKMTFMLDTGEEKIVRLTRSGFLEVQRAKIMALLNQEQ